MLANFQILLPSAQNVCRQHLTKNPSSTSFTVETEKQISFNFLYRCDGFLPFFFDFFIKKWSKKLQFCILELRSVRLKDRKDFLTVRSISQWSSLPKEAMGTQEVL